MKAKHVLTVAISHNLFLDKTQRYDLADGKEVETVGVNLPVWFYKGSTSEPAQEVFCKYLLTNSKNNTPINEFKGTGYKINIPQVSKTYQPPPQPSDEEWLAMSQEINEITKVSKLEDWYLANLPPLSGKNLLDSEDGGSAYLRFRQHNRIKRETQDINIIHFVEISAIQFLEESLI